MEIKYCCDRFANCVTEGEIVHADDNDETEWYVPNWYHLHYCPFCGSYIDGDNLGNTDNTDQIPNTRAVGILHLANDFVQSGIKLSIPSNDISSVRYFLYCHGIELALKSYLVSQGYTEKKLRNIGHNLIRALKEVQRYDTSKLLAIDANDIGMLKWLNSYYKDKEFEYLFVGSKKYPLNEEVQKLAERILNNIKPVVDQSVHSWIASKEKAQHGHGP